MEKFRAKDKNKQWIYGYYCGVEGKHYIIPDDSKILRRTISAFNTVFGNVIAGIVEVSPETIGKYINLLDENKKEIYGSIPINGKMSKGTDILDTIEGGGMYCPNRMIVERHAATFMFIGITKNASPTCKYTLDTITNKNITIFHDAKIIGNAVDNPKLLGENQWVKY